MVINNRERGQRAASAEGVLIRAAGRGGKGIAASPG
jgi:hypothetical protein